MASAIEGSARDTRLIRVGDVMTSDRPTMRCSDCGVSDACPVGCSESVTAGAVAERFVCDEWEVCTAACVPDAEMARCLAARLDAVRSNRTARIANLRIQPCALCFSDMGFSRGPLTVLETPWSHAWLP